MQDQADADDQADDGKGGWTDQGGNDMRASRWGGGSNGVQFVIGATGVQVDDTVIVVIEINVQAPITGTPR